MRTHTTPVPAADPLLLQLYECCADQRRWQQVMDLLRAEMDSRSAVVQGIRLEGAHAATFWVAHDSDTDLRPYHATISDAGNPRMEAKRIPFALGRPVRDEDLFNAEERSVQKRLQQQLSAIGYGRFLGGLVPIGQDQYVTLALHREVADRGDFSDRQMDRLAALLPHFAQVLRLNQSIAFSRSAEALLRGHLDRWECGLIVCNAEGHVFWHNQRAHTTLSCGNGLRLRDGMLHASDMGSRQQLVQALRKQVDRRAPGFIALDSGERRWQLALATLEPSSSHSSDPLLLIAITGNQPTGCVPAESLVALFELTNAESRLASALVSGSTLEEYARNRGVEISTVRYQLKQVLAKTGARRQVDLVRQILCSAAAHVVSLREEVAPWQAST